MIKNISSFSRTEINEWITEIKSSGKAAPFEKVSGWFLSHEEIPLLLQKAADYELDACCLFLTTADEKNGKITADYLRQNRRWNPPTINELALQFLSTIEKDNRYLPEITDTIRKALTAKVNSPDT